MSKNKKKRPAAKKAAPQPKIDSQRTVEAFKKLTTAVGKMSKAAEDAKKRSSSANPLAAKNFGEGRTPGESLVEKLTRPPESIAEHLDRLGIPVITFDFTADDDRPYVAFPAEYLSAREPITVNTMPLPKKGNDPAEVRHVCCKHCGDETHTPHSGGCPPETEVRYPETLDDDDSVFHGEGNPYA